MNSAVKPLSVILESIDSAAPLQSTYLANAIGSLHLVEDDLRILSFVFAVVGALLGLQHALYRLLESRHCDLIICKPVGKIEEDTAVDEDRLNKDMAGSPKIREVTCAISLKCFPLVCPTYAVRSKHLCRMSRSRRDQSWSFCRP